MRKKENRNQSAWGWGWVFIACLRVGRYDLVTCNVLVGDLQYFAASEGVTSSASEDRYIYVYAWQNFATIIGIWGDDEEGQEIEVKDDFGKKKHFVEGAALFQFPIRNPPLIITRQPRTPETPNSRTCSV